MTTVAIISQKGGVGATTIAVNLSYSLARRGWKVLVVDCDLQGGLGFSLTERAKDALGYYDFVTGREELTSVNVDSAIIPTNQPGLSLLTRGSREAIDRILTEPEGQWVAESRLHWIHDELLGTDFDLVIYDAPTGIGPVGLGLASTVDHILVPERPEPLCLRSLPQILRMMAAVKAKQPRSDSPSLAGFVLSMADPDDPSNLEDQREFRDLLPSELVFETVIPEHHDFREASRAGVPVALVRRRPSPSSLIFDQLAAEFEERVDLFDEVETGNDGEEENVRLVD